MVNCPNCGAAIDYGLNQCPYCGTSYYDFSCIDVDNDNPIYLKAKINGVIITALVTLNNIGFESISEPMAFRDETGHLIRCVSNQSANINMEFSVLSTINSEQKANIILRKE